MCEPSEHTNKRFIKDFNLPIPVGLISTMGYYVELLNPFYDSVRKYRLFLDLYDKLGGDEEFFQYGQNIQKSALERIKESESYKEFLRDTSELFTGYKWIAMNVPKGQVYRAENDGKRFLSIDLVKANYQALRYYTRSILNKEPSEDDLILGTSTFNEFLSKFTKEPYYFEAKKFRQVVFGNMNPKRQQKIQKYIMNRILSILLDNNYMTLDNLKDYTSDEIVLEVTPELDLDSIIEEMKRLKVTNNIDLHVDLYTLKWLRQKGQDPKSKHDKFFLRCFNDGRMDFKGIESSLVPQVCKHILGVELQEEDVLFYASNGRLARYLDYIQWEE